MPQRGDVRVGGQTLKTAPFSSSFSNCGPRGRDLRGKVGMWGPHRDGFPDFPVVSLQPRLERGGEVFQGARVMPDSAAVHEGIGRS